jgi:stearoyl-CoA desaturase (delta-9 desaturase)
MTRIDWLACALVLAGGYSLNLLYITVFYHRAVTHRSLELHPAIRRLVRLTGNWVTGLDLKAWACMHRIHHANADGPGDPHSPANVGIMGVAVAQLRSYERILVGLARRDPAFVDVVRDLDFDINWLNRRGLWWLPYVVHAALGTVLSLASGVWPLGVVYVAGIMSHPVQGWIVNSFGHAVGSRNFDTPDQSRNNHVAAWLIWGEGLQNNHHAYPGSARFSYHWWEADFGWVVVRALERVGVVGVNREGLIPRPPSLVDKALVDEALVDERAALSRSASTIGYADGPPVRSGSQDRRLRRRPAAPHRRSSA